MYHTSDMTNAKKSLFGRLESKRPFGRLEGRCEANIKMELELECEGVN
jgi:hypothetical protein